MDKSIKRINSHTKAYENWKHQTQDTFEFSMLVCSAVPVLKRNMKLFEKGIIPEITKADYYAPKDDISYERQTDINDKLKARAIGYKSKLSKYVLISNFSFFESYINDVINEMIEFHGGREKFLEKAKNRTFDHIVNDSDELEKKRRVIRKPNKVEHYSKYKSTSEYLDSIGYKFPSDMLSTYGIQMLYQKLSNMKSQDIPELLQNGLFLALEQPLVVDFHNIRQERNKIAHGDHIELSIGQVTSMSRTLREIAKKLDQHLLRYFFISEDYIKI